jgi:hypothetical protein
MGRKKNQIGKNSKGTVWGAGQEIPEKEKFAPEKSENFGKEICQWDESDR